MSGHLLSIPLNGFIEEAERVVSTAKPYTFNSIEWIQGTHDVVVYVSGGKTFNSIEWIPEAALELAS